MATAEFQTAMETIAQLTAALKEKHEQKEDPKTALQWDDFKAQFETQISELVQAQVDEKLAAQPVRPGVSGQPIGAPGSTGL
jgi:hypothetical protein